MMDPSDVIMGGLLLYSFVVVNLDEKDKKENSTVAIDLADASSDKQEMLEENKENENKVEE